MIYSGWIIFRKEEKDQVERIGVRLIEKVEEFAETVKYLCQTDEFVLRKLNEYWGRYIWSLFPDNAEMGT